MKYSLLVWVLLAVVIGGGSCQRGVNAGNNEKKVDSNSGNEMIISFYNVENLFDTQDDPAKMDEDFTPSGKLAWTDEKYQLKLDRIAEVFDSLPGELPALVGMCEIENRKVLEDLVKEKSLSKGSYAIVHKDSPDERGIDVAVIYDSTRIHVVNYEYSEVTLPSEEDPYTRDLLYVQAEVGGEKLHVFVNHWPSRGGGQDVTEKNRLKVAALLKSKVEKILAVDPKSKILVMGDFNDHPNDKSISQVLNSGTASSNTLFNYMYDDHLAGKGSYSYKGEWGALDQFMGSSELVGGKSGWVANENSAEVFRREFLLYYDKDGNSKPDRTYIGDRYNAAGHSDHLPIFIRLVKN
jgi:predicted extracellular nuclease